MGFSFRSATHRHSLVHLRPSTANVSYSRIPKLHLEAKPGLIIVWTPLTRNLTNKELQKLLVNGAAPV